jgi:uncharacterized protein (DUF952 family)
VSAPIYHITSACEVGTSRESGIYAPSAFENDGFIHCSYEHQLCGVANRLFVGQAGLVILEIDPARLGSTVVDENLEGGVELFPHLYGRLPMNAVVAVHEFPCGSDGQFALPRTIPSNMLF